LKHNLTFSGKSGEARKNQEMKRTEVVTLKFCSELGKVWPGGHAFLVLTAHH